MIHLFRPDITLAEQAAALRALRSGWLGPGPQVKEFEREFSAFVGTPVLTLASCTDGLFLAMKLLNVKPGDEVIVPDIHFIGAASAVLSRGARVVPCDVNRYTLTASVQNVKDSLTGRTKAIIFLHYGGHAADVQGIMALGVPVIEDAALALGVDIGGLPAGTWGDIGLWSFDAMKAITTAGSGGAICVRGGLDRARRLTRLGISEQHGLSGGRERWWQYHLLEPGRLSEMSDVQAAVGRVQLRRLPEMMARRRDVALVYADELAGCVQTPPYMPTPSFYWIQTPQRDQLAVYLKSRGVYTSFKYWPVHRALGMAGNYPGADYAAAYTLNLPLHSKVTKRQAQRIAKEVKCFLRG